VTTCCAVDVTSTGLGTVATITQNNAASSSPALQITTNTTFHGINLLKSGGSGFAASASGIVTSVAGTDNGIASLSANGTGVYAFGATNTGLYAVSNSGSAGRFATTGGAARTVYIDDASSGDALEINNTAGGLGIDLNGGALDGDAAANALGDGTNATQLTLRGVAGVGAYELVVTGDANITGQTQTGTLVVTGTSDLRGAVANSTGNLNLNDDVDIQGDLDMTLGNMNNVGNITQVGNVSITNTTLNVRINDNLEILAGNDLLFDGATADISNASGDVTINDNLVVTGTSDLRGNVSNSTGNLTLNDNVDITGAGNDLTVADDIVLNGATSDISNSATDVTINDNLVVTGNLDMTNGDINNIASISGNAGSSIISNDDLDMAGNFITNVASIDNGGSPITIGGTLEPIPTLTYDLGSDTYRWRDAYIGGSSVHIGPSLGELNNTEMNLSYSGLTTGSLNINGGATEVDITTALTDVNNNLNVDGSTVHVGTLDQRGAINNTTGNVIVNDVLQVTGNVIPTTDVTYSLGTDALRWSEAYVGGTSVHIGPNGGEGAGTEMDLRYAANVGTLNVNGGAAEIALGIGTVTLPNFATAGVVHNAAGGLLSSSLIVNSDITNSTIDLGTKVTGILPVANGGTGVSTTPANGQILIGNGTGYTVANITAGANVSISNSAGGITINAAAGTGSLITVVNKTANENLQSDVTPNNDTHLFFTMDGNSTYEIQGVLYVSDVDNAGDFRADILSSQNVDIKTAWFGTNTNASNTGTRILTVTGGTVTNTGDFTVFSANPTIITFRGIIRKTTAGTATINIQWSQSSSDADNTTVQQDSYITYVKL
jgi:hypothetical protein